MTTSEPTVRTGPSGGILVIDDDPDHLRAMTTLFGRRGWTTYGATDPFEGLKLYDEHPCDLVLLDLDMPRLSGLRVLELLRERHPDAVVLMLTGRGSIESAVEAMRLGAEQFLEKPASSQHLLAVAGRALEKAALSRRHRDLVERMNEAPSTASLGLSGPMREVSHQLELLAQGAVPVLLTGETGTGKSWAARYLHNLSPRAKNPFVEVNCAGLSATFLDSELFGHERGAFTDAKTQRIGLFELADGGTLFLDEIGDLSADLQPKLLRVLETQRFRRLGGSHEIQVDVRLVAATHRSLTEAVADGRFREDLYYRLAVYPVHLPALRDRGHEDIERLAIGLLNESRQRLGRGPRTFSAEALAALTAHPWPGNIRELRNVVERVMLTAGHDGEITRADLPSDIRRATHATPRITPAMPESDLTLATHERRHIERVLALMGNNRSRAAKELGISRTTLYEKLGVEPKRPKS